jgi:hypothetical protein
MHSRSPPIQMCIGVMLELRKGGQKESQGGMSWHPPNRTEQKTVQTYGSVHKRHLLEMTDIHVYAVSADTARVATFY